MAEPGPKTMLTDELFAKIKECTLAGNNIKETATNIFNELEEFKNIVGDEREKELANFIQKFYNWKYDNYLNISDKIEGWQRDKRLRLANITSDTIQTLPVLDENGKVDKELLKIKQKESEFIRETLGKEIYSKRSELTGKDGKDLPQPIINVIPTNNSDKQDTEAQ